MGIDETLRFTVRPVLMTIDVPQTRGSSNREWCHSPLGETAIYIKWQRGKYKGKLPPVACSPDNSRITAQGHLQIQLDFVELIEFTTTFHAMAGAGSVFARKDLRLEVLALWRRAGDERARETLYNAEFDLRDLLDNARMGNRSEHTFTFSAAKGHRLQADFVVSAADAPPPELPPPRQGRPASDAESSQLDNTSIVSRLPVCQSNGGDVLDSASAAFAAAAPGVGVQEMAPLAKVVSDGVAKSLSLDSMPMHVCFDVLFGDNAPFNTFMHNYRRNRQFCDTPWKMIAECAVKKVQYLGRFGNEYKKCSETSFLVAVAPAKRPNEFVKLTLVDVADLPVKVTIHLLTHARGDGSGCTVKFCAHAHFASSVAKVSLGGKTAKHLERTLQASEEAMRTLAVMPEDASGSGRAESPVPSGEPSGRAGGMSLNRDLWARLGDEVAVTAAVAEHYLELLLHGNVCPVIDSSSCVGRLRSLEQLLHRFQSEERIVDLCMLHIKCIVAAYGALGLVQMYGGGLVDTVNACLQHWPNLRQRWSALARELSSAFDEQVHTRRHEIRAAADPLAPFTQAHVVPNGDLAALAIRSAVQRLPPLRRLSFDEVSAVTRLVGLHIGSDAVVNDAMLLLRTIDDKSAFRDHAGFQLLLDDMLRLRPELCTSFRDTIAESRPPPELRTDFSIRFGGFIREEPTHSFSVSLLDPPHGSTSLYLTDSFVCIGNDVFERRLIAGVEEFRSAFVKPALALKFVTQTGETTTVKFSLWSRTNLLTALESLSPLSQRA